MLYQIWEIILFVAATIAIGMDWYGISIETEQRELYKAHRLQYIGRTLFIVVGSCWILENFLDKQYPACVIETVLIVILYHSWKQAKEKWENDKR